MWRVYGTSKAHPDHVDTRDELSKEEAKEVAIDWMSDSFYDRVEMAKLSREEIELTISKLQKDGTDASRHIQALEEYTGWNS